MGNIGYLPVRRIWCSLPGGTKSCNRNTRRSKGKSLLLRITSSTWEQFLTGNWREDLRVNIGSIICPYVLVLDSSSEANLILRCFGGRSHKIPYRKPLERIQRLGDLCMTGALRTTPMAALERLLNLPPIAWRHSSIDRGPVDKTDHIPSLFIQQRKFPVTLKEGGWRMGTRSTSGTYNIYTDRSKMADGGRDLLRKAGFLATL